MLTAMRILPALLLVALTSPAFAQGKNKLEPAPIRKDDWKQPRADEQAYRKALDRIPDKKVSQDPWGAVREADKPKNSKKEPQ